MKTLKQIREEKSAEIRKIFPARAINASLSDEEQDECLKEWLKQELQELPCKKCKDNDICQRPQQHALENGYYGCLNTEEVKKHNQTIDKLLEKLEK